MRRFVLALAAAFAGLVIPVAGATAAPLPSGTISCQVFPEADTYLRIKPFINADPSPNRLRVQTTMVGTCDNSGVSGGKAPITTVEASLIGRLVRGTNCTSLLNPPQFERLKLKIKWRTIDGNGRSKPVATSTAYFVDATWDDVAKKLVLASQPLKGGFAGSTSTTTLTLEGTEILDENCPGLLGLAYGSDGESSITIP